MIGACARSIVSTIFIVAALLLALTILVRIAEPWLTFMPVRDIPFTPDDFGLPFDEVSTRTSDGLTIHGWFIPADGPASGPRPLTLLHFHGNAENIAPYAMLAQLTRGAGYNLLLLDYRGYGRSEGRPSEAGIYRDGEAALRYLRARADVDPDRIVLWGRSIGAAVAVHLAATETGLAGVVLESPFTSARELLLKGGAILLYPLSFLSSYRFDQASVIPRATAPILIAHGTADEVVPYALGRRLFERAPEPKEFLTIEGGGHNDLMAVHADALWDGVNRFLEALR